MSKIIDELVKMGMNKSETMERFLDDEEFYISCLPEVINDPRFELLGKSLQEKNIKESFEHAHTLKGVISNMGLASLYSIIVEIVEPLRKENIDGLYEIYEKLMVEREKYAKLMNENEA